MPRNGTGGYSLPSNGWNPAINGTAATAADWQQIANDIQAAIQQSISSDGQTPMTGSLKMGGFVVTGLGAPSGNGDSLRWEQVVKGSDIASASSISIPNEGSLFDVTGTTTITTLTGSAPGRVVSLRTIGSLQFTNSASLMLPNGKNITSVAGSVYIFLQVSPGVWLYLAGSYQASTAPIGSATNLKSTVSSPTTTATITADEVTVGPALGGIAYKLSGFSQVINLSTVGAGGMDSGVAPISGFVAIYAIYNPITGATSALAVDTTIAAAPMIYAGAFMPAGYTSSALLAVWPTNSSRQLIRGSLIGRRLAINLAQFISTTVINGSFSPASVAAIPLNAVEMTGILSVSSTVAGNLGIALAADSSGIAQQSCVTSGTAASGAFNMMLATPRVVYFLTTGSGSATYGAFVTSYTI